MISRRGFLAGLGALVGGVALEQAIPFGRVWSFPKEVVCLNAEPVITPSLAHMATVYYDRMALRRLEENLAFFALAEDKPVPPLMGQHVTYRFPAA